MRALLPAVLLVLWTGPLRAADDGSAARDENRARIEHGLQQAYAGALEAAGEKPAPAAPALGAPQWKGGRSFGGPRRAGARLPGQAPAHDSRPADSVQGELVFVLDWGSMVPGFSFLRDAEVLVDGEKRRSGFTPANAHLWSCSLLGKEPGPGDCFAGGPDGDWDKAAVAGVSDPAKPHRVVFRAAAGGSREFAATAVYDGHGNTSWVFSAPGCADVAVAGTMYRRGARAVYRVPAANEDHCPLADRPRATRAWDGERFR
jgi:hypothetical protein